MLPHQLHVCRAPTPGTRCSRTFSSIRALHRLLQADTCRRRIGDHLRADDRAALRQIGPQPGGGPVPARRCSWSSVRTGAAASGGGDVSAGDDTARPRQPRQAWPTTGGSRAAPGRRCRPLALRRSLGCRGGRRCRRVRGARGRPRRADRGCLLSCHSPPVASRTRFQNHIHRWPGRGVRRPHYLRSHRIDLKVFNGRERTSPPALSTTPQLRGYRSNSFGDRRLAAV